MTRAELIIKPWRPYFWVTPEGSAFYLSDDSWWPSEQNADGELDPSKAWTAAIGSWRLATSS
jgi:hypothetical protein